MRFEEAVKKMMEGCVVALDCAPGWNVDSYIYLGRDGKILDEEGNYYSPIADDIVLDRWYVVDERGSESYRIMADWLYKFMDENGYDRYMCHGDVKKLTFYDDDRRIVTNIPLELLPDDVTLAVDALLTPGHCHRFSELRTGGK